MSLFGGLGSILGSIGRVGKVIGDFASGDVGAGIKDAVGGVVDYATGVPISSIISAGASLLGGQQANSAAAAQAQQQEAFQADMSGTSYQRAVVDMRKAGLNPMLAYTQGGASTPAGAMAPVQNVLGNAVNSALQASSVSSTVEQQSSQAQLNKALAAKAVADTQLSLTSAKATAVNADLSSQDIPSARNAANLAKSWFGRHILPVLPHLNPFVNSASSAASSAAHYLPE